MESVVPKYAFDDNAMPIAERYTYYCQLAMASSNTPQSPQTSPGLQSSINYTA